MPMNAKWSLVTLNQRHTYSRYLFILPWIFVFRKEKCLICLVETGRVFVLRRTQRLQPHFQFQRKQNQFAASGLVLIVSRACVTTINDTEAGNLNLSDTCDENVPNFVKLESLTRVHSFSRPLGSRWPWKFGKDEETLLFSGAFGVYAMRFGQRRR